MLKKRTPSTGPRSAKSVARREALKGLGAIAVSFPALAAFGCGDESAPRTSGDDHDDDNHDDGQTDDDRDGDGDTSGELDDDTSKPEGDGGKKDAGGASADAGTGGGGKPRSDAGGGGQTDAGGQNMSEADAAQSAADGGAGGGATTPPMFEDAQSCTLTATDRFGEGPFLIKDEEVPDDISLVRSDIRDGHPGLEFRMHFRVLDAQAQCAPVEGVEVYIWHCDADGYYSGFGGQDPSKSYSGGANPPIANADRFCRGVQTTDADGVVSFTTVYPGWYAGRPIHVHLLARLKGASRFLLTTQLYFPAEFTMRVHSGEDPYKARVAGIPSGSLNPPSANSGSGPTLKSLQYESGLGSSTLNVIINRA